MFFEEYGLAPQLTQNDVGSPNLCYLCLWVVFHEDGCGEICNLKVSITYQGSNATFSDNT